MSVEVEKLVEDARNRIFTSDTLLDAVSSACRIDNGQKLLQPYTGIPLEKLLSVSGPIRRDQIEMAVSGIMGGSIAHYFRKMATTNDANFDTLVGLINETVADTPLPAISQDQLDKLRNFGFWSDRSNREMRQVTNIIIN